MTGAVMWRGAASVVALAVAVGATSVAARSAGARLAALDASPGVLAQYRLGEPADDLWELPDALQEISGLAVDADGRVFAHDDERAIIYQLDPASHRVVKRFSFGRPAVKGDFEAIALADGKVVLTTSDGVLYAGAEGDDGQAVPYVSQATGAGRFCEVEGLVYEPEDRALLLGCKTPRARVMAGHIAVLRWSLDRKALDRRPSLFVPLAEVKRGLQINDFRPSELFRVAGNRHYLVLAGPEHAVAEIGGDGQVIALARLRRKAHPQAEGLAITPDGALLVADEGAGGRGRLSVYRPH